MKEKLTSEARPRANLDLREWLRQVDEIDELKLIEEVDWNLEIGALTEMFCLQSKSTPCLLFDQIKGHPAGMRLVTNTLGSLQRTALTLKMPPPKSHTELVKSWREASKGRPLLPMNVVTDGAVMENVCRGADVDITKFPAPVWHEDDGGRYLGTGSLVVTR
ncbi:MAG: UbiD family decarboxylase, partial [Chloroflexi bacterium]|nr:UbiD family decarboxylase [Chloroflexota bacterium]